MNEIINKLDKIKQICKENFRTNAIFYKIECMAEDIIAELDAWENRDAKDLDHE